jgi:hypothetical protein
MTLYIHATSTSKRQCSVKWATATSSVGGEFIVSFLNEVQDQKALAEIYVLDKLLDRYPGKASCIETSQGKLRKLLNCADQFASTEIATLDIKYRTLSIRSHKKTEFRTNSAIYNVESPLIESAAWTGIGRPSILSSIGPLEITKHAMTRFRERFCENGSLTKMQHFLKKQCVLLSTKTDNDKIHSIYSIPEIGMRFVLSNSIDHPSSLRMTTCYSV